MSKAVILGSMAGIGCSTGACAESSDICYTITLNAENVNVLCYNARMSLSVTSRLIIAAAQKRGWQVTVINERYAFYRLNLPDGRYYYVRNIRSHKTASTNVFIASKKDILSAIAETLGIRMPETITLGNDREDAYRFLERYHKLVVKPADQSHGDGITVEVDTRERLDKAIIYAQSFSKDVLIQRHIEGDDYRVLYIDGKLAAAAIRKPAFVIGDGIHTVSQLIEAENAQPDRSAGYNNLLTTINIEDAGRYLGQDLESVPAPNEEVRVMGTANIGKGGVAFDVTDTVSQEMQTATETILNHLSMGLAGVDFLVEDGAPYLIEINASPSLGLHELPYRGEPRHTPDKFLDWLAK